MVSLRVNRALRHKVPPAADVCYEVGYQVWVFREKQVNNKNGEWLGPYIVKEMDIDQKLIYFQMKGDKLPKTFELAQVKKYLRFEENVNASFLSILEPLSDKSLRTTTMMLSIVCSRLKY